MPSASCRQVYAIHKATVAWQINTLCICENIFEHAAQTFSSANLQEAPPQTAVGSALEVASATAKRRQIETCSYLAADSTSNAANHNDRMLLLCLLNKSSSAPPPKRALANHWKLLQTTSSKIPTANQTAAYNCANEPRSLARGSNCTSATSLIDRKRAI